MQVRTFRSNHLKGKVGTALTLVFGALLVVSSCSSSSGDSSPTTNDTTSTTNTTTTDTTTNSTASTTTAPTGPTISSITWDDGAAYDRFDMVVEFDAEYGNPLDSREVTLDVTFTGPDDDTFEVPGFWDADDGWAIRFTPDLDGAWSFSAQVTDSTGPGEPFAGEFEVAETDSKGFIRPGDWVDPSYSPHYFAYDDGTPWFGVGHANLGMGFGGFSGETFKKMSEMETAGENFNMWWPLWVMNFIQNDYATYNNAALGTIDLVVAEAEKNDIALAFTIWNHQLLRTPNHPWGNGLWASNGFQKLVDGPADFFVDDEAWAWQENMYRYIIARWGYSTSVAMWQTVTEINGTESYDQTDPWHARINEYFQTNDPYRHPTTATKSGGEYWPTAFEVMDVPQMHVYEQFHANPIESAEIMASWTQKMWDAEDKPNWIGEYGERLHTTYPEFMHNSNWATLAAGAATIPAEWNDPSAYGQFDEDMQSDMLRISEFIDTVPLVHLVPEQLGVSTTDDEVRGWGVAGENGGVIWVQDFTFEATGPDDAEDLDAMRSRPPREGVTVRVDDMPDGNFAATPYNTWTGEWLDTIEIECTSTAPCEIELPTFTNDLALRLEASS